MSYTRVSSAIQIDYITCCNFIIDKCSSLFVFVFMWTSKESVIIKLWTIFIWKHSLMNLSLLSCLTFTYQNVYRWIKEKVIAWTEFVKVTFVHSLEIQCTEITVNWVILHITRLFDLFNTWCCFFFVLVNSGLI